MSKLREKFKSSDFIKDVAVLTTGTGIAQLIPILVAPVLSRLFTVDDFGVLSLFNSIAALLTVVATLSYDKAIMLPKSEKSSYNLLGVSLLFILILVVIGQFAVIFFNKSISSLFQVDGIGVWLYWVPLAVLFRSSYEAFVFYNNRQKRYKNIASSRVVNRLGASGGQVLGGLWGIGVAGLVLGSILGGMMAMFTAQLTLWNRWKRVLQALSFQKMKYLLNRYRRFPLYTLPSAFLNMLSVQIPVFLLSVFFSQDVVGLYGLSHRVLNIPIYVIGQSIGNVYFQKVTEMRNDDSGIAHFTFRLFRNLIFMGLFPMLILAAFGSPIFSFVFGEEWAEAGAYAEVLSPWILFVFASAPLSRLFWVLEKQNIGFYFNLVLLFVRGGSILLGYIIFKDSYHTIFFFAMASALIWMLYSVMILHFAKVSAKSIFFLLFTVMIIFSFVFTIKMFLP